jgi:hypothetical protein
VCLATPRYCRWLTAVVPGVMPVHVLPGVLSCWNAVVWCVMHKRSKCPFLCCYIHEDTLAGRDSACTMRQQLPLTKQRACKGDMLALVGGERVTQVPTYKL